MEYILVSQQDINNALKKIDGAKCCIKETWFNWVQSIVRTDIPGNVEKFLSMKEKVLNHELFTIRQIQSPSDIKRRYLVGSQIIMRSEDYFVIGNDNQTTKCRLQLTLPVADVANVVNARTIISNKTNVYAICCGNRVIKREFEPSELPMIKKFIDILNVIDDVAIYDCSGYEITDDSQLIQNIKKFKKLN